MFHRTQTDDHQRIGKAGLCDAEAMDQNFFMPLSAHTQKDMPEVVALADTPH